MKISFVIPAHNEEDNLGATLDAIRDTITTLALNAEVIVANDASTDRTVAIATEAGARVISHERRQIAATRNLGARAATGELLMFIDADTLVNAAVVREAMDVITSGAVGGGAMVEFDGEVPRYARVLLRVLTFLFRLSKQAGGACFFCRRDTLEAAGWWDESVYAGEEIDLARALKKHGRFEIVRSVVVTSGRKLRTYSGFEILKLMSKAILSGKRFRANRENLDLWYAPRREDPGGVSK